jgi:plastocyanin
MRSMLRAALAGLALVAGSREPLRAQATHVVRLVANAKDDIYRFEPANVVARPGDALVFRVVSGAPHSVVFEGEGLSPGVRGAFNTAMPNRSGDLSSPLFTAAGADYRMVVPQVPSGTYSFYCLPHRAYDMRGSLTIR